MNFFCLTEQENENGGQTSRQCTVMSQNSTKIIVPCNGLFPFVCTRTAGEGNVIKILK